MSLYVMSLKWRVYNVSNIRNALVTEVSHIVLVKIHVILPAIAYLLHIMGKFYIIIFHNLHNGLTDKL